MIDFAIAILCGAAVAAAVVWTHVNRRWYSLLTALVVVAVATMVVIGVRLVEGATGALATYLVLVVCGAVAGVLRQPKPSSRTERPGGA